MLDLDVDLANLCPFCVHFHRSNFHLMFSLQDGNLMPDVRCKVVKWLKTHAYFNSSKKNLKQRVRSTVSFKAELGNIDNLDVAPAPEADTMDPFADKSVPPKRRTRSNVTILNGTKVLSSSAESFNNNWIILDKDMEDRVANEAEKYSEVSVPDAVGEVTFVFLPPCFTALLGHFFKLHSLYFAAFALSALPISHK